LIRLGQRAEIGFVPLTASWFLGMKGAVLAPKRMRLAVLFLLALSELLA
jgi:hypothetical protein